MLQIFLTVWTILYFIISIPYWIDQQINWLFQTAVQIIIYIASTSWTAFIWLVFSSPSLVTTADTFVGQQLTNFSNWSINTAQDLGHFCWDILWLILYSMWFVLQLIFYAIAFTSAWYIGILVYCFLTQWDFTLQGEFYFGPHPQ